MEKKLLYGFGDSLVDGHCVHCGMLDALAEKYGMVYRKYAINGAAVIPCKEDSCEAGLSAGIPVPDVAAQIEAASGEVPDFICFDGLTNDAYPHTVKMHMGSITGSYGGNYDTSTFYGAFERVCFLLRKKYMDSRIFYICVHKMPTRDMAVQEILHRAAREVCEKWSIPCVDIFRKGQINTCVDGMHQKYSYDTAQSLTDGNGTHLNPAGYEKWYLPMIEEAMGEGLRIYFPPGFSGA